MLLPPKITKSAKATWCVLLGLLVIAQITACKRAAPVGETSPSEPTQAAQQEGENVPANPPPAVQPAAAPAAQPEPGQTIAGVVDPRLTAQLRIFVQEKGRMPETFAEFAGARLDSVPRLQPGLAFAIDPTTQEVKIVRK